MKHLDYSRAITYNYHQIVDEFKLIYVFINRKVFITLFCELKCSKILSLFNKKDDFL